MDKREVVKPSIIKVSYKDTWPIRHQVMWPSKPIDYIKLERDKEGIHFALEIQSERVSVVSLFINEKEAQIRKLATKDNNQRKGYGSKLISHVLTHAKNSSLRRVWCNARKDKTSFYKKFGFKLTKSTFSKGGIDYVIMEFFF